MKVISILLIVYQFSAERRTSTINVNTKKHHHHHHKKAEATVPVATNADAMADQVLQQLSDIRYKATKATATKADGGSDAPLEKVNVGELSCRARTATNVGLD